MVRSCHYCKSVKHVGDACPLHVRALGLTAARRASVSEQFSGPAPAPFVGKWGYPAVRVGLLAAPASVVPAGELDSPKEWVRSGHSISTIAGLRCSLVNSHVVV